MQKTKYKGKKVHYNAGQRSPAAAEKLHLERKMAGHESHLHIHVHMHHHK